MGLVSRNSLTWVRGQDVAEGRQLDIADHCGIKAFKLAETDVCQEASVERLMPVALAWLNCKLSFAGVSTISCGRSASDALLSDHRKMAQCASRMSSEQFLQLMDFTMLSFDACYRAAQHASARRLRKIIAELVSTTRNSVDSHQRIRALSDSIAENSDSFRKSNSDFLTVLNRILAARHDSLQVAENVETELRHVSQHYETLLEKYRDTGTVLESRVVDASKALREAHSKVDLVVKRLHVQQSLSRKRAQQKFRTCAIALSICYLLVLRALWGMKKSVSKNCQQVVLVGVLLHVVATRILLQRREQQSAGGAVAELKQHMSAGMSLACCSLLLWNAVSALSHLYSAMVNHCFTTKMGEVRSDLRHPDWRRQQSAHSVRSSGSVQGMSSFVETPFPSE